MLKVEVKLQSLEDLQNHHKKDIAAKYGIPKSTISTSVKNKAKYIAALEQSLNKRKKTRKNMNKNPTLFNAIWVLSPIFCCKCFQCNHFWGFLLIILILTALVIFIPYSFIIFFAFDNPQSSWLCRNNNSPVVQNIFMNNSFLLKSRERSERWQCTLSISTVQNT